LTPDNVTYSANGPFVVEMVAKAQKLLSVEVPLQEGPVCALTGERSFVINSGSGADTIGNVTRARATSFLKSKNGSLEVPKEATLDSLEKLLTKTHSCHRVTARPVVLKDASPFMRTLANLNGLAGADDCPFGDEDGGDGVKDSWYFACDCGGFLHNGSVCSHICACAHAVEAIDLGVLITQLGGRRLPGRPRKNFGGPLDRVNPSAVGEFHSAKWYSERIEKKGAFSVYKHRTVRLFGVEGGEFVGKVTGYRELSGKGLKQHGIWKIFYKDDPVDDNTEELDLKELCEALSLASRRGLPGYDPSDMVPQVI